MAEPTDLDQLREQFPGWEIEAAWTTVATGPDRRVLHASRGDVTISAWTAEQLAREIGETEAGDQVEDFACDVPSEYRFRVRRILREYRAGRMAPRVALAQLRGMS
jgi:hypothetical protein